MMQVGMNSAAPRFGSLKDDANEIGEKKVGKGNKKIKVKTAAKATLGVAGGIVAAKAAMHGVHLPHDVFGPGMLWGPGWMYDHAAYVNDAKAAATEGVAGYAAIQAARGKVPFQKVGQKIKKVGKVLKALVSKDDK